MTKSIRLQGNTLVIETPADDSRGLTWINLTIKRIDEMVSINRATGVDTQVRRNTEIAITKDELLHINAETSKLLASWEN